LNSRNIFWDLVDIRRVRHALEESEARRQALLDSALDCIICTDSSGKITDFNSTAERTFRIPRTEALGKDLANTILPPDIRYRRRRELLASTSSVGIKVVGNRLETRAMRSDGAEFPAELTVTTVVIEKRPTFTVYVRDITARKRAEETLLWLAAIVESSQDAIIGKDLNRRITSWNKGAQLMYGYTADEVIGKDISLLVPPGNADEILRIMEDLREGRRTENFETIRKAKDGKLLNVALTVSPILNSDRDLVGASVIARNITRRKLAEEALRKANETSVYASPVPIVAVDASSHVTIWNPAAERVFGWSEQEVLGKPNPIIPSDEAENAAQLHEQLLQGATLTGVELRRQRRDGSLMTVSASATPLWDETHRIKGIIGFFTDISERKRAEMALRSAEEKYRSILENAAEGIYQSTTDGKYVFVNPALARMLGFDSPEELINTRNDIENQQYVSPGLHAEFVKSMEEHGTARNFEYQARRKDGNVIWVSENARTVQDPEGRTLYFEGTVQDITQRRELEQQVQQMQKIEAIGRLAGGVAHDFNNILMAISSYAELLYRRVPEEDTNRRYIDEIVKATNRGSALTQSLLAFSRKQVLSPKVLDMNALIADQIDMLKRLITENIELRFVPCRDLGRVRVDPGQIEQVVMNLVINARDAMPNGGQLVIETGNAELDQAVCPTSENGAGTRNYVLLAVSDNGYGMDTATKSHIFEPFFSTKEQGKGTGLGLATVFGIVKQSSGHIFVHSEPGHGTTFKIHFPRVDEAAESHDHGACEGSFHGNETILLVEDEEAVREPATEYLTENGYVLLKASCGSEALVLAEQHNQPIHLLLTDLVMPKMSGRELAEKIACIHPETKVVFMSGYSNNLISSQQILDPKHVLLQKPFRLAALGRCIRETLSRAKAAGKGE
jgi:two-component system cell cycle sensor histidine kinase/response regulator CckA